MKPPEEWRDEDFGVELRQALQDPSGLSPSVDLFSRVVESIDADRHRRRHAYRIAGGWAVGLVLATVLVLVFPRNAKGAIAMPWWILELFTTAVLVGIALWLGPFIKRFGRAYAADVFHDNPLTGKSYIVLTDVVYYLIFTAYIFFTVHFAPPDDWRSYVGDVTASQLQWEVVRVGGILLIIGILHGLNIVLMPVLGRLFSLNRRLPVGPAPSRPDDRSIYQQAAELERAADDDSR